ncbi:hypothetical protein EMMF5_002385 [Cystobasidiomycetes sp. EMM_F5]
MSSFAPLQPLPQPLGLFPNFSPNQYTTLILKENMFSFSGNDYQIKDQFGNCVLQADGQFFSFRNETRLLDAYGRPMITIRRKLLSMFHSYSVFGPGNDVEPIFRAEGKFSPFNFKPKFTAWFTDALTGRPVQVEVVGNWLDYRAEVRIVHTGQVIARLHRDYSSLPGLLMGRDTYVMQVAPHVDLAFIVALGIIYDERQRARRDNSRNDRISIFN